MPHSVHKKPAHTETIDRILFGASFILSILGILVATYLLVYKLTGIDKMCLGNGDCATVNYSPYSEIFGIPVALLGIVAYLAIGIVYLLESRMKLLQENGRLFTFGMSLVGVIFSTYLTYIEIYKIKAICPYCVSSAVIITLIFILSIIRLVRKN
jgi:uncharacterized membrane protein